MNFGTKTEGRSLIKKTNVGPNFFENVSFRQGAMKITIFGKPLHLLLLSPLFFKKLPFFCLSIFLATNTFSEPLFPNPVLPVGVFPAWIAGGDFNEDGNQDLAVANVGSDDVSILFGNGDGTFQMEFRVPVGMGPFSLAVDDFNLDGHQDLAAVLTFSETVTVLFNDGLGKFSPNGEFEVGEGPRGISLGDFNSDGKTDLAVSNRFSNDISVLLGNGDGTFQAEQRIPVGESPMSIAVGEFNGDGNQDLTVANGFSNTVSVLFGMGDGTFGGIIAISTGSYPFSVSVDDLNGDGKQDISTANLLSDDVTVLLGQGNGSFYPKKEFGVGNSPIFHQSGDFNSDGIIDLSTLNDCGDPACFQGDISIIFGNGDGTFQPDVRFKGPGEFSFHFLVGDFNNDSDQDFAAASIILDDVVILLGNGNGGFDSHARLPVGRFPKDISIGDFNNDSLEDLIVLNRGGGASGDLSLIFSLGNEDFLPEIRIPAGDKPFSFSKGDYNSDGMIDLAVTDWGFYPFTDPGHLLILLGNGVGAFDLLPGIPVSAQPFSIISSDFNFDGEDDLSFLDFPSNNVTVFLGNGDGSFGAEIQFDAGENPGSIAVGDFNSDEIKDLAISNFGFPDGVSVLSGNRDGTFVPPVFFPLGTNPNSIIVGDFNNDEIKDFVVVNAFFFSDTISIIFGNGDGSFGPSFSLPVGLFPVFLESGDLNSDGNRDILVANLGSDSVSLLIGNGDGSFEPEIRFRTGTRPISLKIVDFNGDLRKDIAVTNDLTDTVSVLFNKGLFIPFSTKCSITPSNLNLHSMGRKFSISTSLHDRESGDFINAHHIEPGFISRISSPTVGELKLPVPSFEPGCDDLTEDGIWENVEDRSLKDNGGVTLRFDIPSDGQCETMDGGRQDIIALMLDIPNKEIAKICYQSKYPGISEPFECCGEVRVTNHGNR